MKFKICAFLLLISSNTWADLCSHTRSSFDCVQYLRNYDGDTVTVNIGGIHELFGKNISVRVRGIDTPEKRGKGPCEKDKARTAQKLVENLLKNSRKIKLLNVGRDKYFRILAEIEYDGKNLKDALIKNNLAYPYDGGTKKKINWCDFKK